MKSFFLSLILAFAVIALQNVGTASAASVGPADGMVQSIAGDGAVLKAQYGGGGGDYDGGYRRRGYDDDDDGYRERRRYREHRGYDPRGNREYCWSCERRCEYGWCPPRCWGWHRYCRRGY